MSGPRLRRGVMTDRWGWQPFAWEQNGLPTWRYGYAPRGLLTRRQMRAAGLGPGGAAAPVAQVVWTHKRHEVRARLWDRDQLVTKRTASPAQLVALGAALAARRWCPSCCRDVGYCIPTSLGECAACAFPDLELDPGDAAQVAAELDPDPAVVGFDVDQVAEDWVNEEVTGDVAA